METTRNTPTETKRRATPARVNRRSRVSPYAWLLVALVVALTSFCIWFAFHLGLPPGIIHGAVAVIAALLAIVAIALSRRNVRAREQQAESDLLAQEDAPDAGSARSADGAACGTQNLAQVDQSGKPSAQAAHEDEHRALERLCSELAERYDLSTRERDVLLLLAQGKNRLDIENELVISMNTVKSHLRHIYQKLGVHSRKELDGLLARERRAQNAHLDQGGRR